MKQTRIEAGSGNVFADIGMPDPEKALAKAKIALRVNLALEILGLNEANAGALLGIAQSRVSDLACGRLAEFSLEDLIDFARRSGNDVEIHIRPTSRKASRLKVIT
jgi:predicted XRE-type DNA-binding protein